MEMKTEDAIRLFGTVRALADAIGVTEQAIYQWGEDVPELRAYQIAAIAAQRPSTDT